MSLNPNTRTECVEVLLNPTELITLDAIRGGLARSPFFRSILDKEARSHGKPPSPPRESRGCRGAGRLASRASADVSQRRHL